MVYKKTRHVTTIGVDAEVADAMRAAAVAAGLSRLDFATKLIEMGLEIYEVEPVKIKPRPSSAPAEPKTPRRAKR